MSWGTPQDYDKCLHLEGAHCQLYACKLCKSVNHRKVDECAFRDKDKFNWANPLHQKALEASLELFMGESIKDLTMDVGGQKIVIKAGPAKRKVLGSSPLDKIQV